ncbi:MAG: sulfotransferase [Bdellovibrionales bacterium]|nr:sulfotransferase [Bdellovibrionales bacterium]
MLERLPNLYLVGVAKSATTALWHQLKEHPQINGGCVKEPHVLSSTRDRAQARKLYEKFYGTTVCERYMLDASVLYGFRHRVPHIPYVLKELSPEARILFVLREPFERLLSHFRYRVTLQRSSADLFRGVADPYEGYLANSSYPYLLKPFLELFGRRRVMVVTTEEFCQNPGSVLQLIYSWLDLDWQGHEAPGPRRQFETPATTMAFNDERFFGRAFLRLRNQTTLRSAIPPALKRFARKRVSYREVHFAEDAVYQSQAHELHCYLRPLFQRWNCELEQLLDQPFTGWGQESYSLRYQGVLSRKRVWVPKVLRADLRWLDSFHREGAERLSC